MAEIPENPEPGVDLLSGGVLSQQELDALIAAADADSNGEAWAEDDASSDMLDHVDAGPASAAIDLPSFGPSLSAPIVSDSEQVGLSRVRDIPLEVTVELGRTRLLIRDILDLGTGSIIELDKLAGEPVELFANSLLVARGEVVVIDDNFGVRVTEIITAADRRGGKAQNALAA